VLIDGDGLQYRMFLVVLSPILYVFHVAKSHSHHATNTRFANRNVPTPPPLVEEIDEVSFAMIDVKSLFGDAVLFAELVNLRLDYGPCRDAKPSMSSLLGSF
jgi:hypothetical protein